MPDAENTYERETAKICSIKNLLSGTFVKQDGWKPNYITVGSRTISRVNIMGVVVEKPQPHSFMLDDGTATISVTDFDKSRQTSELAVGDPVLIIGRPRKIGDDLFIACEIAQARQVKKNPLWMTLRKQQLQREQLIDPAPSHTHSEKKPFESKKKVEDSTPIQAKGLTGDDLIDYLKENDDGSGCDVDTITDHFGADAEETIHTLITMGEIYEIRPGKIKVLE